MGNRNAQCVDVPKAYAQVCALNVNGNYLDNTLDKALDLTQ
jgi:hypothetical protein